MSNSDLTSLWDKAYRAAGVPLKTDLNSSNSGAAALLDGSEGDCQESPPKAIPSDAPKP